MKKIILPALFITALLGSCKKTDSTTTPQIPAPDNEVMGANGFNFSTSKTISVNIRLLTNDDQPLKGVLVNVYSTSNTSGPLFTSLSDNNGYVSGTLNVPAYMDSLIVDPAYIGLMRNAIGVIKSNSINGTIGGANAFSGDFIANDDGIGNNLKGNGVSVDNGGAGTLGTTVYSYLNTYDYLGRPNNLATSAVISSQLLSFINASLPEQKPVPTYHPDFLTQNAVTNLNIEKTSDVWITFVHEGAGYYNSLGYYKYQTNNPPKVAGDIDSIKIAIPNASLLGSGGNMRSGDKIYLGKFAAGTSVGFVLLQNAWNSTTRVVNTNAVKYYADDALNTEKTGYKRHTVLLYDNTNKLFLEGFEDLQRDNNASDNDFNDLIFYASANPVDAISTNRVNPIDQPIDTDGDGVTDIYDKFPNDASRAYIQYFPSATTRGTLAFEDLWPSTGDYDLNDLIVTYKYTFINNALNKTIEIDADYAIQGIGATMKSGFGVQFPFTHDKVSSVTGQKLSTGSIKQNTNGTEASQTKAVIIPFDDPQSLIPQLYANTVNGQNHLASDTVHIKMLLSTPLSAADLGTAPFNPFIICNQMRGYEVHLPGQKPTDKADTKVFGTADDITSPSKNIYYLNKSNGPWALSFTEPFDYPAEGNNISKVYNYFLQWAQSGGTLYIDWYKDLPGYRNNNLLYKH